MNQKIQNRRSITVAAESTDCKKLFTLLSEYLKTNRIDKNIHHDLKLIIEETFSNIVNHAHETTPETTPEGGKKNKVTVELNNDSESIKITFTDSGTAFNPCKDCDSLIEDTDPCDGGMGIHIIKSLSDHLEYRRIGKHNVFTVTKHYTKQK